MYFSLFIYLQCCILYVAFKHMRSAFGNTPSQIKLLFLIKYACIEFIHLQSFGLGPVHKQNSICFHPPVVFLVYTTSIIILS